MPTKVHLVKAMIFEVVMYVCESHTIKKAEHWRIDAFELWCWRRLFFEKLKKFFFWEDSWASLGLQGDPTSPSYRKLTLNIHWKDWCWSWSCNTWITWCKELTHWERPWCWARLKAEGEEDSEDEMVGWHHRLNGHEFEQALGAGDGQASLVCCSP